VYVPDFFDGQHVPFDHFTNNEVKVDPDFDLQKFLSQNGRSVRMQSIVQAVQDIKALPGVHKVGVIGVLILSTFLTLVLLGWVGLHRNGIS
jgi:hypothetical protein